MYQMCGQTRRHEHHRGRDCEDFEDFEGYGRRDHAPIAVVERDPAERLTDADRERAAALLSQAFRDGILQIVEFDLRLSSVYAAQTVAELDEAMIDLPRGWVDDVKSAEAARHRTTSHRRRWRAELAVYLKVMALLVGIWFATNLGDVGEARSSFWPIWPILGWGIPLFLSRPRGPIAGAIRERRMARAR